MLILKGYQEVVLGKLQDFVNSIEREGIEQSFMRISGRNYLSVPGFPGMPYVCLKVPTGGGKTLLASSAVGLIANHYLRQEHSVCLWLVPSKPILEQTLKALKDRNHPYRQEMDRTVNGPVTVLTLDEALSVQQSVLDGSTVVIVSTLAAPRISDVENRKIYDGNGALLHHFTNLSSEARRLLPLNEDGVPVYSLANVLRLRRPIIVMDEAHNARTELAFETLERLKPSCILEFTATPSLTHDPERGKYASNILCQVSALELKAANMIKLPLRVAPQNEWEKVLQDAIAKQNELETIAKKEKELSGEYIRPILLIQAEDNRRGNELTPDFLVKHLIENHRIGREEIALATQSDDELAGLDLLDNKCPIKYVITKKKLAEGWDCSFAYVLCSLAKTSSERAIEQILGRILRLPKATRKINPQLNQCYAFVRSPNTHEVVDNLEIALTDNGFAKLEARMSIIEDRSPVLDNIEQEEFTRVLPETVNTRILARHWREHIEYRNDTHELVVRGPMETELLVELEQSVENEDSRLAIEELYRESNGFQPQDTSPAGRGELMKVPVLSIKRGSQWKLFDNEAYLEIDWHLSECDSTISEREFPNDAPLGGIVEIDVNQSGRISQQFIQNVREEQALLQGFEAGWSINGLANWLVRRIPHKAILPREVFLFVSNALIQLVSRRKFSIEQIAARKYELRDVIETKIISHRDAQLKQEQLTLFENIRVTSDVTHIFGKGRYSPNDLCPETNWKTHFFPLVGKLDSDEEYHCARTIDNHPNVKYWVRNLVRKPDSFRFPLPSEDYFYPDFVVELKSGIHVVVEYKGEIYYEDAAPKRAVAEKWAAASKGKCRFVMPRGYDLRAVENELI